MLLGDDQKEYKTDTSLPASSAWASQPSPRDASKMGLGVSG